MTTVDFESYLPENAKEQMLRERIQQLAAEGLANQIAKTEAEARGAEEEVAQFDQNIAVITTAIQAAEAQLP